MANFALGQSQGQQRHQHGVKKNLVEFSGGLLAGAAGVLLLRRLFNRTKSPVQSSLTHSPCQHNCECCQRHNAAGDHHHHAELTIQSTGEVLQ
ncbi:hypothetical protein [Thiospirillum jenense]|uniref:Uncharacterized protein n=1 Tax=Thiospirillum jenense TaxID=1653858 RepID=A0A839HME8_9GAMM|nr:hypothetical protein [Thiospirillum jenense]MBB1127379.1 hypothetical protein [Thiospirillum jenense]